MNTTTIKNEIARESRCKPAGRPAAGAAFARAVRFGRGDWAAALVLAALLLGCGGQEPAKGPGMIVYESYSETANDIYIMNEDGSDPRPLVSDSSWNGTAAPSPDGKRLAFASERDGDLEIFVMSMDGSGLTQLTFNDSTDFLPAWSPDGQRIAFSSDRVYQVPLSGGSLEVEAGMELYVMNADGTDQERLTGGPDDVSLYASWSPDGKKLTFMILSTKAAIYTMDMAPEIGEAMALMPESTLSTWSPRWSPDGKYIAFMGDDGENKDIYRVDADGQNLKNLTADWPAASGDPSWSPDGRHILFAAEEGAQIALYVMTADGEEITTVADASSDRSAARPSWFR